MLMLSLVGLVALAALAIILGAAYMINAERFEVTGNLWKMLSLSIKIESPCKRVHGYGKKRDMGRASTHVQRRPRVLARGVRRLSYRGRQRSSALLCRNPRP
jgi:hypothetical protein